MLNTVFFIGERCDRHLYDGTKGIFAGEEHSPLVKIVAEGCIDTEDDTSEDDDENVLNNLETKFLHTASLEKIFFHKHEFDSFYLRKNSPPPKLV